MPPKRPKSGGGAAVAKPGAWEQGVTSTPFCEDKAWNSAVAMVVGHKHEDYSNIKYLAQSVKAGYRKLFNIVTKEELFELVEEFGNPKAIKKGIAVPMYCDICEVVKALVDANEEVPLPLLAKLIKWKLLDIKTQDQERRAIDRKDFDPGAAKGKGDKKDRGKSANVKPGGKKEGGKKTPEPSSKNPSKLKMRGEEDESDKLINDEPDDGPEHYVFLSGFHHPHLISQLAEIGVFVDCVIGLSSETYSRFQPTELDKELSEKVEKDDKSIAQEEEARLKRNQDRKEIAQFWRDFPLLAQNAPPSSHLLQVPSLEYMLPDSKVPQTLEDQVAQETFGKDLYETVACMVYDLLDHKRHWKLFLENLHLTKLPTQVTPEAPPPTTPQATILAEKVEATPGALPPASPSRRLEEPASKDAMGMGGAAEGVPYGCDVDMRYYEDLMGIVPQECVSVPLILHCMLEQVVANEEGIEPPSETPKPTVADSLPEELQDHFATLLDTLGLAGVDKNASGKSRQDNKAEEKTVTPKLINFYDHVRQRLGMLKAIGGFDPLAVELEMLKFLPIAQLWEKMPELSGNVLQQRTARLQELVHFVTTGGLTQAEVDRCLKQFVLECLDFTSADEDGNVVFPELPQTNIPWDDPYPYFKGMALLVDESDDQDKVEGKPMESATDLSMSVKYAGEELSIGAESDRDMDGREADNFDMLNKTPYPEGVEDNLTMPSRAMEEVVPTPDQPSKERNKSILRRPHSRGSNSSVHFEQDEDGQSLLEPGDSEDESDRSSEGSVDKPPGVNDPEWSEINDVRRRNLDQYCFAEHLEHDVLVQLLQQCYETHSYIDTYYHRRDHSLLVVMHNPYNSLRVNEHEWTANLHSDIGFRNFMQYIAEGITDWTRDQDAQYQASLLASEVCHTNKDGEEGHSQGSGKKERGKKTPGKAAKSKETSRASSEERKVDNLCIRASSIKAWKDEQERIKREEEIASRAKERATSAKKKNTAEQKAKEAEDDKKRLSPQRGMSRASAMDTGRSAELEGFGKALDPDLPFKGYDMGDNIIRVSGKQINMFPADGAFINVETINFEQMGSIVKARLIKDGHCFNVHVLDPKSTREEEEEVEQEPPTVPQDDGGEPGEKKDEAADENEHLPPAVGRFGSFTGHFSDGLSLSLSIYGTQGEPKDGAPYTPAGYDPPPPAAAATDAPNNMLTDGKVSQAKSKGGKRATTPEMPAMEEPPSPPEPEPEPEVEQEPPINRLNMTCPDGLMLEFLTEGALGLAYEGDRRLCIRQSYPFPTRGEQGCENGRIQGTMVECSRLTMRDGTTVKTLRNGEIQILYPDGTYTEFVAQSQLILQEPKKKPPDTPGEAESATGVKKTGSRQSKKALKEKKEEEEVVEVPPAGYWITTKPDGERIAVTAEGKQASAKFALVSKASDPATGQYMLTRDDQVVSVHHPDQTSIVEHHDGTRITTFYKDIQVARQTESSMSQAEETGERPTAMETMRVPVVVVECPGFASLRFDHDIIMTVNVELGIGSNIQMFANGTYDVYHQNGGFLHFDEEGGAMYYPRSADDLEVHDPSLQLRYSMRHFADVILETVDNEGNVFNVASSGECRMLPTYQEKGNSSEDEPEYKQHAPKIFILQPDGTGIHMTRFSDIADFMIHSEEDPATAILMDSLPNHPGVVGFTVLKPWSHWPSEAWLMDYIQKDIVPPGLVSRDLTTLPSREMKKPGPKFGTTAGRGLSLGSAATSRATSNLPTLKCPDNLLVRQIMQYRPITHETRNSLWQGVRLYGQFVRTKLQQMEAMIVRDPRSTEEQDAAKLLQEMAVEREPSIPVQATKEDIDAQRVSDLYDTAMKPEPPIPPPTPVPKRTAADWERDRRELQEEKRNKAALRNKTVPKYFNSELGQAFLLSQSADTRTFPASKNQWKDNSSEGKKTQVSKSETPGTNPSPQTMVETVSPSKVRPGNPTPELATGTKTPTGVRPINPTPGHAIKEPDRPVAPTPKQKPYGSQDAQKSSSQGSGDGPDTQDQADAQKLGPHDKAVYLNVLGEPRTGKVRLPGYLKKERVLVAPNIRNQLTEFPVRRRVLNSSVAGARIPSLLAGLQGLRPSPASVHFGTLREGGLYRCTVTLMNTGVDLCRYRVKQPPLGTGIKAHYKPGPVAPGMRAELVIEVYALAVGVEGTSGTSQIQHRLEVVTETDHLYVPIMATTMTAKDYDKEPPGVVMTGPGIFEIEKKVPPQVQQHHRLGTVS